MISIGCLCHNLLRRTCVLAASYVGESVDNCHLNVRWSYAGTIGPTTAARWARDEYSRLGGGHVCLVSGVAVIPSPPSRRDGVRQRGTIG